MSRINIDSIMKKVQAYANTSAGKALIKSKIKEYRETGIEKTAGGSVILTEQRMCRIAENMITILKTNAGLAKLPQSVLSHFDSLEYTRPLKLNDTSYFIEIHFTDDLSRLSLKIMTGKYKGKRTGDGIENIVSLFDTGYPMDDRSLKPVHGVWDGHEEAGIIRSRTFRDELRFMQNSIDEFNRVIGKRYGVVAYLNHEDGYYAE